MLYPRKSLTDAQAVWDWLTGTNGNGLQGADRLFDWAEPTEKLRSHQEHFDKGRLLTGESLFLR